MSEALYKGIAFSPQATLTENIGEADTIIKVSDSGLFPDAPNLATIGIDEDGETILYAAKAEGLLSGCVRGVEGTAKPWRAGEPIARNFTAKDHNDLISTVMEMQSAAEREAASVASALADKQDKLTGTPGQIVGFDAGGNAVSQDAPETGVTSFNGRKGAVLPQSGDYTAEQVGADPAGSAAAVQTALGSHMDRTDNPHQVTAEQAGAAPVTRTVNGKALSADISLTASDVGAVPATRTVNGKALGSDITLSAADVGARPSSWMPTASDVGALPSGTAVPVTSGGTGQTSAAAAIGGLTNSLSAETTLAADDYFAFRSANAATGRKISAENLRNWIRPVNTNLLDNWYFPDPVNQRWGTEYTGVGYAIDRWKLGYDASFVSSCGITLTADGLVFQPKTYIRQYFEHPPVGQKVVLSALIGTELITFCFLWDSSAGYQSHADATGWVLAYSGINRYIHIISPSSNAQALRAMKLELGTRQTLAHKEGDTWVLNDPPPNRALELAKCQRYYYEVNNLNVSYPYYGVAVGTTETTALINIPLPIQMRTRPAVKMEGTWRLLIGGYTVLPVTSATPTVDAVNGATLSCLLDLTIGGGGVTPNYAYTFSGEYGATVPKLSFSADL